MNAPPPELPEGLVFEQRLTFNGHYWTREVRNAEGRLHNPCGPALERFIADTGHMTHRQFFLDGKLHNENGPASEIHDDAFSGCYRLEWFVHNKRHNPYRPAVLKYSKGGELKKSRFYLNGTKVDTEEEFLALTMASKSAGKR